MVAARAKTLLVDLQCQQVLDIAGSPLSGVDRAFFQHHRGRHVPLASSPKPEAERAILADSLHQIHQATTARSDGSDDRPIGMENRASEFRSYAAGVYWPHVTGYTSTRSPAVYAVARSTRRRTTTFVE